jgi:hypothetical protein
MISIQIGVYFCYKLTQRDGAAVFVVDAEVGGRLVAIFLVVFKFHVFFA